MGYKYVTVELDNCWNWKTSTFTFGANGFDLKCGDCVSVDTARGVKTGKVIGFTNTINFPESKLRNVLSVLDDEDDDECEDYPEKNIVFKDKEEDFIKDLNGYYSKNYSFSYSKITFGYDGVDSKNVRYIVIKLKNIDLARFGSTINKEYRALNVDVGERRTHLINMNDCQVVKRENSDELLILKYRISVTVKDGFGEDVSGTASIQANNLLVEFLTELYGNKKNIFKFDFSIGEFIAYVNRKKKLKLNQDNIELFMIDNLFSGSSYILQHEEKGHEIEINDDNDSRREVEETLDISKDNAEESLRQDFNHSDVYQAIDPVRKVMIDIENKIENIRNSREIQELSNSDKKKNYNSYIQKMIYAESMDEYYNLAIKFTELNNYNDSPVLAQMCKDKLEEICNEKYNHALSLMQKGDANSVKEAECILQQITICDEKAPLIHQQKEIKQEIDTAFPIPGKNKSVTDEIDKEKRRRTAYVECLQKLALAEKEEDYSELIIKFNDLNDYRDSKILSQECQKRKAKIDTFK